MPAVNIELPMSALFGINGWKLGQCQCVRVFEGGIWVSGCLFMCFRQQGIVAGELEGNNVMSSSEHALSRLVVMYFVEQGSGAE